MLQKIGRLFSQLGSEGISGNMLTQSDLQIASAALLVHAVFVDGHAAEEELQTLRTILKDKYDLSDRELEDLLTEARVQEKSAVDLYSFTRTLTSHLGQEGRKDIVRMLWQIVLADGQIDEYESHLLKRVSELLGVSTRDRVLLRQSVEASLKS